MRDGPSVRVALFYENLSLIKSQNGRLPDGKGRDCSAKVNTEKSKNGDDPTPHHHGNLPNAFRAASRAILDETGPEGVGLREAARRVGVSATAAYRHFTNKDDLLASVAAEGFRELAAAMRERATGADQLDGMGLAYVEFALQKRGLFRLMFGPILVERAKYPRLNAAASGVFDLLQGIVASSDERQREDNTAAMAAWGLVHGLSLLFVDGLVPETRARDLAEQILVQTPRPEYEPAT
jgi:AcrR family transcriptional regulator